MDRIHFSYSALVLVVTGFALSLTGCGQKRDDKEFCKVTHQQASLLGTGGGRKDHLTSKDAGNRSMALWEHQDAPWAGWSGKIQELHVGSQQIAAMATRCDRAQHRKDRE